MLRSCAVAPARIACVRTGYCSRTSGWLAVAVFFASAPSRTPPDGVTAIALRSSRVRSTSVPARSTSYFSRSMRLVPPARYRPPFGSARRSCTAFAGESARAYLNGVMARLLPRQVQCGQLFPPDEPPGLRPRRAAGVDVLHRGDDLGVGPAAADVAAHPLADFVVCQLGDGLRDVRRRVARVTPLDLAEH